MHAYTLMLVTALGLSVASIPAFAQVPTSSPNGRPTTTTAAATQAAASTDRFIATARTYAPRYGRPGDLPMRPFGFGYTDSFLPSGFMFLIPGTAPAAEVEPTGLLSLRVQPAHAQVFVDGALAGTAADFAGRGQPLDEGPHRVEVRADGYETHAFDRRIMAGDTSIYRYDMWALRTETSPNARLIDTVAVRRPFYVISGCYAGNRPPTASQLPAGCSVDNVRTVEYMVRIPAR